MKSIHNSPVCILKNSYKIHVIVVAIFNLITLLFFNIGRLADAPYLP